MLLNVLIFCFIIGYCEALAVLNFKLLCMCVCVCASMCACVFMCVYTICENHRQKSWAFKHPWGAFGKINTDMELIARGIVWDRVLCNPRCPHWWLKDGLEPLVLSLTSQGFRWQACSTMPSFRHHHKPNATCPHTHCPLQVQNPKGETQGECFLRSGRNRCCHSLNWNAGGPTVTLTGQFALSP